MNGVRVAVVGATGAVGRLLLEILEERNFPVEEMYALASPRSEGESLSWRDDQISVQTLEGFDFSQVDLAFFAAGSSVAETYAPVAVAADCTVIDNSSRYRYDPGVPLVVPDVNPDVLDGHKLIANPNCSTAQMVVALKPLHDLYRIRHIEVATYQSVSGAGQKGIDRLEKEIHDLLQGRGYDGDNDLFDQQIAFNALPAIDVFQPDGYSREEWKMVQETQKIFADDNITLNPTCVRVPVFYSHSEAVSIRTASPVDLDEARAALSSTSGVVVLDNPDTREYATAITGAGRDEVFVSRLRRLLDSDCGMNLWVVSDNLRKGAALNAVQIAELIYGRAYMQQAEQMS